MPSVYSTIRTAQEMIAKATGRPRIPGDGDGDGIPNEGKKPSAGGAAPGRRTMTNVGTDKWPLHAVTGTRLSAPDKDGNTHAVGGFKPPVSTAGKVDGDVMVHIGGSTFHYSGKTGAGKSGERAYEYSDENDRRAWVSASGRARID